MQNCSGLKQYPISRIRYVTVNTKKHVISDNTSAVRLVLVALSETFSHPQAKL